MSLSQQESAVLEQVGLEEAWPLIEHFSTRPREHPTDVNACMAHLVSRLEAHGIPVTVHRPSLYLSLPGKARVECGGQTFRAKPPAFSAAASAWAMNGRDRLPRERMRPSRMRRSSSRVITSVARGMLLPVLTMTCKIRQAVVRKATSCQVFNHLPLSTRPTAAHLAAFILPSLGRLASATLLLGHWCDILRIAAMGVHASHCGLRRDDVGTNKRSIGELAVDGCAFETRDDVACSVV